MTTIMLTLHGFLLTSCILLSAKTTLLTSASSDDGDIFIASSGNGLPSWSAATLRQATPTIGAILTTEKSEEEDYHQTAGSVNKSAPHKCPVECTCGRDNEGRLEVLCLRGNSNKSCFAHLYWFHAEPYVFGGGLAGRIGRAGNLNWAFR